MITKTITYDDLDGNPVTEEFCFHLNKIELLDLEVKDKRGLQAVMEEISKSEDTQAAFEWIKEVVLKSYGKRGIDGKGFDKTPELRASFQSKEAFGDIVIELLADANGVGTDFFNKLVSDKVRNGTQIPGSPVRPPTQDHQAKQLTVVTSLPEPKPVELDRAELERRLAELNAKEEQNNQ